MASRDVIEQVALRAKQSAASGSRKGASQQVIDAVRERAQKAAGTVTDSGFVDPRPFVGVSTETDGSRYAVPAGSTTKSSTGKTTGFTMPPKKSAIAGAELSPEQKLEQLGQSLSKKWKNQMQLGTLDDVSALRRSDPLTAIKAQRQARMDALKQELEQFGPDDLITRADEIRQKEKELLALEKEDKKADFEQLGAYLNEQQLARAKQRQQQELNDGKSHPLGHLATSYVGGVSDWVQGVVDAIDGIMPGEQELPALQPFRYGKQAIENVIENYGDTVDPTARKYGEMIARGIGYSTPSAVAAMLPGVQGLSAAAGGGVTGLLKNPSFWMSAVPTYGSSYADAKNDGADELQAQAMAILNGFAGAAVEVGGGIEQIPNSEPGIKTWIKGMLDEGKEEVLQGVIEQLAKKIVYDHDRAFYSLTDEDALINPNRAAQEFLGGALVGGVLGGAQTATQAIARYSGYSQIGQNVMQSEGGVETALSIGLANAKTTEEYQAALRMAKDIEKGKAPSAYAVGKLVADSQSEQAVRSRQINSLLMKSAEEYKASAETADAVAAVATRFGRPIVFADPEKLNGAAGLYDADSDVIAVSPKLTTREAVDFVLKHELTHAIEGSETYADLAAIVRQQMGEEGFAAAVEKTAEQRRAAGDESGAQSAEKEVIADWIGNNLFRKGFADKVTAKSRTLGEQFYRALWNVRRALGFTDSATQSERIRAAEHAFADQLQSDYRRGGKAEANADAIAGLENVQYSIKTAPDGQKYVDIDVDQSLFNGLTDIEKLKMAEMVIRERFVGKVIGEEETAYVTKYTAKEYGHPAKHLRDSALVDAKARASTELDNLLAAATGWKNEPDGQYGHAHKKAAGGFDRGTVLFKVGDELYQGMINIEVTERGRVLKDITQISVADEKQRAALSDYRSIKQGSTPVSQSNSDTSVSQETSDVNTQYMQNGTKNAQRSYLPDELSAREQETDSSKARIKEQLRAHQDELNAQAPVSEKEVDYTFKGFQKSVEWAAGFFADGNDRVYRPDMGEIVVDKKRIRKALRYVKSESEVMAFAALEDVIRKGTAIDGHSDHKGRGYETVTIAAPVVINGIRFNMAAVIRKDGNNYYKVHRILMPDGSIVDLKKAEVTSRTAGGAKNDTHLSPNDVTSEVTPNRAGGIDDDTHLSPNGDASVDSIARSAEKSQGESFQRAYLPDDLSAQERAAQAENAKRLANRTDAQTDTDIDTEAEYDEAAMDEMIDKAAERRRTKLQQAQREETARLTEQLKNGEIDADTFGREMERLRSEAVADNEKKWRRGERGPMEQREQIRRERRTARADYVEKKAQLEADTAAQKAADTQKRRADSERKKKAEYRRQASKIVDELDSLLSHPSKDRHVPLEALNTVREVLETVSEDPQGIRQEMDEIRRQMAETADQRKITRLERQLDARKKRLAKVSDMLGRVQELGKTTEGDGFALAQDGFFAKKIAALRESMDGKTIDALTANETKEVVDVLRAIVKQMRDINTFHSNAMREGVTDTAVRFIREMDAASAYGRLGETIRNMMTWQLTPDRFFEAVCGWKTDSVGKQIADSMTEAEKKELSIRREFGDLFDDAVNGKGRKSYDALGDTKHLVDIGLRDAKGQPMQMTRGMMLSLYMQLNCPANRQALIDSGFIVPELKRYYKGDVENAYANGQRLTPTALSGEIHDVLVKMANAQTDIERQNLDAELTALTVRANQDLDAVAETIAGLMTDDERQFVKLAQQWFNDISKKHINEATREVWGYEAARVKDYFPLYRSKFFVTTGMDSLVQDMTVGNTGSLKSRVHSKAPINLADISQVLTASVDTTAKFSAWLGFTTDFQKLYNAVTPGGKSSVKETLARKWGKGKAALGVTGDSYVQNLMADISGNRRADASPLSFFRKNAVRATLTLNLRVAVSQAASLPTAVAEIGWKYTGKALKHLPKVNAETMALIRKYSPYFWERSRGAGGTEEIALAKSGQNAIDTLWSKLNKATHGHLLNWCQEVDVRTVALCWFGCEERIQAERPDLKVGSDAYYQAVGEMLDTVIRKTQPNFTVTERSDLLRSKNEAMKFLTMYKTQANQQMNILYEATGRYRAAQQAFKNGTGTKAQLDAAKQRLVNGYTGVIGGTITLVLLRTLVNVLIHKVNGYRDEDGEVTAASMAGAIGQEMLSSIAGSYAFGDVVYEAVAARVFGSSYYGVSDTALETAGNLLKDFATGDLSSGKTWQYVTRDLMNVLGIPYKNVADMAAGLGYHIEDIHSGEFLSMNAGYTTSDGMFYRRLYRYTQKDDTEKAQHLRQYLLMTGKTEEQIDAGMRTAIKGEDRDYKKEQERLFREVCRSGLYGKLTDKEKKRVESGLSGYVADKVMAEKTGGTMTAQHIKVEAYAGRGVSPADYYLAQTVKNAAFADADGDGKVSREEYRRVLTDEQYDGMIRQLLFGLK